ncbi:MAG: protease modulator HflC, partial [Rhodospirillales bacterium]|nr:protease modulator HflC [Rhodospirillales bacterium]MCW8969740.1 protease modulator HflC [Rhodospirillales bacterium]
MNRKLAILGALVVVATMVASGSLFTVLQTTQAIVVQLGEAKRVIKEPGLNWKLPLVQNVIYYDKRVLDLDPPSEQVLLADQKRINVDAFARYRITDPLRFFQSVQNEAVLRDRFGKVLNSSVRSALGQNSLLDLLSPKRDDIMSQIKERVAEPAKSFGIEVVDVRIGRSDLPEDISKNVYDRMRSEREREANLLRAEGD